MIDAATLALVTAAGAFLLGLGTVSLVAPTRASRFFLGFAGSPGKHYAELAIRVVLGAAFLLAAPRALWPGAFTVFGWLLLVTSLGLLLVPWRVHRRFAERAVPQALRFLPLLGASSMVWGGVILWAVFRGHAAQ